jgi:hypothetical protein
MLAHTPILKIIYGSQLYGTFNSESDTDYKEVILPDLKELICGKSIVNTEISTGNSNSKNSKKDIDKSFIPLQNFLDAFIGGQSYAIEIVYGVISPNVVKKEFYDPKFQNICEVLAAKYLTSDITALMGYISSQSIKYGIKGKRLIELEKIKSIFINCQENGMQRLHEIPVDLLENDSIKKEYVHYGLYLGVSKELNDPCLYILDKIFPLTITIKEALERITVQIANYGHRTITSANVGGADFKALSHAIRIAYQIIELLTTKKLEFPLKESNIIREIKEQRHSLEFITDLLTDLISQIDVLKIQNTLPSKESVFDDFLAFKDKTLLDFYKPSLIALINE